MRFRLRYSLPNAVPVLALVVALDVSGAARARCGYGQTVARHHAKRAE